MPWLLALLAVAWTGVSAQAPSDEPAAQAIVDQPGPDQQEDQQEDQASDRQSEMPIMIDAESSEFDYTGRRLIFKGLRLDQGNLGIRADTAETEKLDFNEGEWVFTGNVVVEAENTRLECDSAELSFKDHELTGARLSGKPARFEQPSADTDAVNSGAANEIVFDMQTGTLNLMGEARFSDGVNEISGELITYDLTRGRLTAGAGESGPVKILIEPPTRSDGAPQSP